MNVLGVDGSGRKNGNTAALVRAFLEGAAEAGAETAFLPLADKTLRGCAACKACKAEPAKVCVIQDDMQPIYERLPEVDVLLLASPVYLDHITAQLMAFIQRTYCYISPSLDNYWPREGVRFAAGITYGAGDPDMYNYVLDWMSARMEFYFGIPTVATFKVPGTSHERPVGPDHPEVRRARAAGRALLEAR